MTWSWCWESTEYPTSSGQSLPCCSAQVCALGSQHHSPTSSIPQASVMLDSQQKHSHVQMERSGMVSPPGATREFRNKNTKLSPECSVLWISPSPAPAQVEAGDERVVWSQPSPLLLQPRTPSSSREGLFIFLKTAPVLLGGKCCTQGRAELQILQQYSQKPAPERMAVLCLGPSQQHPLSSTAPLQGLLQSSEYCRDTEEFFQDLQPRWVLTNPRLGANSSPVSGVGQELPGMEI